MSPVVPFGAPPPPSFALSLTLVLSGCLSHCLWIGVPVTASSLFLAHHAPLPTSLNDLFGRFCAR